MIKIIYIRDWEEKKLAEKIKLFLHKEYKGKFHIRVKTSKHRQREMLEQKARMTA